MELTRYGIEATDQGLFLPPGLTVTQWGDVQKLLDYVDKEQRRMLDVTKFQWGDWMLYGELCFGEEWSQYLDPEGKVSLSSLESYRYVSRCIPPEERITNNHDVTWSHHRWTVRLNKEQRAEAFQTLLREKMTCREFETYIKANFPREVQTKPKKRMPKTFDEWVEDYIHTIPGGERIAEDDSLVSLLRDAYEAGRKNR